jgi:hypothetical protein
VFIEGRMNSELYVSILQSGLRATIEYYDFDLNEIISLNTVLCFDKIAADDFVLICSNILK